MGSLLRMLGVQGNMFSLTQETDILAQQTKVRQGFELVKNLGLPVL